MKKIVFFMTIICLFFINNEVKASETLFYEGEKIDNIYTKSVGKSETHFQKSRFFRRKTDNTAAYCIEPFESFYEEYNYSDIRDIKNIDDETLKRISLIAYYGYNYDNHTDDKWYAITQLMVWRETNKNDQFFFTDTLNGNRINRYEDEINEINNLVNNHDKLPSFSNKTLNIRYGEKYIYDENNIIDGFTSDNSEIIITNNKIDISKLKPGKYKINFKKILIDRGEDILFYYNEKSQNLMTVGNSYTPKFTIDINIYNPSIKIEKYDKDDSTIKSKDLCSSTFNLYDKNMKLIKEISLDDNCSSIIDNIDIGTYYIKEIKSGTSYKLNNEVFKIELSIDNYNQLLKVYNEKIKNRVKIHKDFNDNTNNYPEENVKFDIYNNDKYVDTITTDSNGNSEITLEYGEYTFKQVTSKDGYGYVDDFNVLINEDKEEKITYNLVDYKIKVPDTRSYKRSINYIYILFLLLSYLYVKEKIFN